MFCFSNNLSWTIQWRFRRMYWWTMDGQSILIALTPYFSFGVNTISGLWLTDVDGLRFRLLRRRWLADVDRMVHGLSPLLSLLHSCIESKIFVTLVVHCSANRSKNNLNIIIPQNKNQYTKFKKIKNENQLNYSNKGSMKIFVTYHVTFKISQFHAKRWEGISDRRRPDIQQRNILI